MPCSAFARLLFIGLGVEADDKGIFEWKPVTLKMNIFPGDSLDIEALLSELLSAEAICRFEHVGRHYGAIRNFRKYQRPKTPNDIYPMPTEIAEYVSFPQKGEKTEDKPPPFPPKEEITPQMEDGGGNSSSDANASAPPAYPTDPVERLWAEGLDLLARMECPPPKARPNIGRWMRDTRNDAGRVLDAIRRTAEHGTKDPIPMVGRLLNPIQRESKNATSLSAHTRSLADRIEASQRGEPMFPIGGDESGGSSVRLLSDGRGG